MCGGFKPTKTLTISNYRDGGTYLPRGQYVGRRHTPGCGGPRGITFDQFTGEDLMREIEKNAGHIDVQISQDARRKVFKNKPGAYRTRIVKEFMKELETKEQPKQVETAQ